MPKANRVYIASKIGLMEGEVARLRSELMSRGYEIIYDWTKHPVAKPFAENLAAAARAAENMAFAVMQCDILIVLWAERGVGFHIETGGALVSSLVLSYVTGQKRKQIFLVGEEGYERSIFYFHPSITRVPTWQAVLDHLALVEA